MVFAFLRRRLTRGAACRGGRTQDSAPANLSCSRLSQGAGPGRAWGAETGAGEPGSSSGLWLKPKMRQSRKTKVFSKYPNIDRFKSLIKTRADETLMKWVSHHSPPGEVTCVWRSFMRGSVVYNRKIQQRKVPPEAGAALTSTGKRLEE